MSSKSTSFGGIYHFISVALFLIAITVFVDPCRVPYHKRKDCGYSGITVPTCLGIGKIFLMAKDFAVLIKMMTIALLLVGTTYAVWKQANMPQATLSIYLVMSVYTWYSVTGCCYDGNGPEGLPHCYH